MRKFKLLTLIFLILTLFFPLSAQTFSETYFTMLPAGTNGTAGTSARYVLFGDWPQSPIQYGVRVDEKKSVQVGAYTYYYGSDDYWYAKADYDYYKVEPIKWRIVTDKYNGNTMLLSENALMLMKWYDDSTADSRTIDGKEIYDNNYEHSRIRAFLNGLSYTTKKADNSVQLVNKEFLDKGFLQTAFSENARTYIADTKVNNSPENSATETGFYTYNTASLSISNDTVDKVFILSRKEATTKSYGFGEYYETGNYSARLRSPVAFAEALVDSDDEYKWWLRSPYAAFYSEPLYVDKNSNDASILSSLGIVVGEERNLFIENAKTYLGVPYVYGGLSRSGIDCSGLTYLAAQSINLQIPRTAALQYEASERIKDAERQPGDLVFFSDNGRKVSHVGIYVGDGKMLNAVSSGTNTGVVISSLSAPYWVRTYYGAGRIFKDSTADLSVTQQETGSAANAQAGQDSPFFHHATHYVFTVDGSGSMSLSDNNGAETPASDGYYGVVPALCISSDIPVLKSIEVASAPTKTTYSPGEELDLSGLVITAIYSDGSKKPITRYTTSGFNTNTEGTRNLTIHCSELLVEKDLNIEYKVVLPVIEISSMPSKTTYDPGQKLDLSGLLITATYYDGTKKAITNYTTSGFNSEIAGNHKLTIRCQESFSKKEFTIDYTVTFPFKGTFTGKFNGTEYTELPKGTNGSLGTKGRYVLFGDWPQTKKASNVSIDETKKVTSGSFTYYLGSDGYFYAKVAENAFESYYRYSDGTIAETGKKKSSYFKVEPIKWRIVTNDMDGAALLVAENVLTTSPWYKGYDYIYSGGDTNSHRYINETTIYPNNYEYSTIRAFLNGLSYYTLEENGTHKQVVNKEFQGKGFLQTAFSQTAQNKIVTTNVDNSTDSTQKDERMSSSTSRYLSNDTKDKIFLLSVNEITRKEYGFGETSKNPNGQSRARVLTDFAKAQGACASAGIDSSATGIWWLRSPYDSYWQAAYRVDDTSVLYVRDDISTTCNGVVPALRIPSSMVSPAPTPALENIEIISRSSGKYSAGTSAAWILLDIESLLANYNDGSSREVMEYTARGFNTSKPGTYTITISYTDGIITADTKFNYTITGSTENPSDETYDYKVTLSYTSRGRSLSTSTIPHISNSTSYSGTSGTSGSTSSPSNTSKPSSSSSSSGYSSTSSGSTSPSSNASKPSDSSSSSNNASKPSSSSSSSSNASKPSDSSSSSSNASKPSDSSSSSGYSSTSSGSTSPSSTSSNTSSTSGTNATSSTSKTSESSSSPSFTNDTDSKSTDTHSSYDDTKITDDTTPQKGPTNLPNQARVSNTLRTGYTELPAGTDGSAGTGGKYVLFGEWPQSLKASDVKIDEAKIKKSGSFIYYYGSDNCWYAEVYAMYFKVEPIKWRVLTEDDNGNMLLLAENSLADCQFYEYIYNRTIDGEVIHPNNYEYSRVRAFLNGLSYPIQESEDSYQTTNIEFLNKGFLQTAFSYAAQKVIVPTIVDNSASSTTDDEEIQLTADKFVCSDTTDKIFLLSEREISADEYYFLEYDQPDDFRIRTATDYLELTGEIPYSDWISGRYWWLRSPYYLSDTDNGCCVRQVLFNGKLEEYDYINDCIDVVPALWIAK